MAHIKSYKERFTFEKRKEDAEKLAKKYPDRIPIIVEKVKNSTLPDLDKQKFLVEKDVTMSQFCYIIRKRVKLKPDEAIYMFVNNQLPPAMASVYQLHKEFAEKDGLLYLFLSSEQTFGN